MIYYRTRHTGKPAFSVRINDVTVTQYTFVDGDEAERAWHEIIPASTNAGLTLRPDNNSWSSSLATVPSSSGMSSSSTRRTRPPFRSPSSSLGHSAVARPTGTTRTESEFAANSPTIRSCRGPRGHPVMPLTGLSPTRCVSPKRWLFCRRSMGRGRHGRATGCVAGPAPAQRDCFVLPVRHGRGGAAPRRAWQPEPPQWRALELCKKRHGRVGAVAEYMLAPLGVPAAGLSRTEGIVAWTGPSGY
jgi:hypothetical protein